MDKKAIIAVTLAILTMVGWQYYSLQHLPPPTPAVPQAATTAGAATAPDEVRASSTPATPAATAPALAAPQFQFAERTEKLPGAIAEWTLTNKGGGIKHAVFLEHKTEIGKVTLNEVGSKPIGAVTFDPLAPDQEFSLELKGRELLSTAATEQQVQIAKKFSFPALDAKGKDAYIVPLEVTFTNRGDKAFETPQFYVHTGSVGPLHEADQPTYTAFNWFREGKLHDTTTMWFDASYIPLIGIQTKPPRDTYVEISDKVAWAGVRNQYFTSIISPDSGKPEIRTGAGGWARRLNFTLLDGGRQLHAIEGALIMPGFKLAPGETKTFRFQIFNGPREFTLLKKLKQDEDRIMHFGMFRIFSETLLSGMHYLKGWLGNYGLAIILLTIIIKSILWPIQNVATKSAKKMQVLAPRLKELQAKYKDDPLRAQQEYSKMLKEYGINPFGGCLPMLITIPIFFGFFWMLGQSIELRGASFLWINDLSQPDTIFRVLGFPINILPIIMAGTSFWQMALMPKAGDPTQQKILTFMPLIFIVFCYNFASALSLYYTVQNLFSIVQLYATRNQPMPVLEKIQPATPDAAKKKKRTTYR